ncbi:uncharacterized protein PODANS_6_2500 [Podospora anserina S mat+]|uniref:Podospora anserina S mat+ genomic DNA chromosome 6, supercontig 2 n=1 Tax=Podospora anserina (strain S / ATCC MYA-4624 / DSM 980 / FGSC 10383) TaxID=515849 RepID=B2B2P5_PODAN|nr:uncharacterized protein PODANS_6_2500 [Podospora anserina S mat+]CAP71380.1 unnamed protein product [Podospora anserina S mat+]CDP30780.1 Putative protein of unknown function [Podospora anserina S mat+]
MSAPTQDGIRIACTPCHRKKITCNKELPCARCTRLKLACDERYSGRYKARSTPHTRSPEAASRTEISLRSAQSQSATPGDDEGATSVSNDRAADPPTPSEDLEPRPHKRRLVGLRDLLNVDETLPTFDAVPPLVHEPWNPRFYRFWYPWRKLASYLEMSAPEVLEFTYNGGYLTSNSVLHVGLQLQIRSERYPDASKVWIERPKLLTSITQHLEVSGTWNCGLIGADSSPKGVMVSCVAVLPGIDGVVLPATLGEIVIRWQQLSSLLLFRQWGGFYSTRLGPAMTAL